MKKWSFLVNGIYMFAAITAIGYDWCEWYAFGVFVINLIKFMIIADPRNIRSEDAGDVNDVKN